MPQVTVTINGRVYRMGCDDGQEQVVLDLADDIDRRIESFKASFGEVGDMRLMLMAAMAIGDELSDTQRRLRALEAEIESLREARAAALERAATSEQSVASALEQAAARIERLAATLNGAGGDPTD